MSNVLEIKDLCKTYPAFCLDHVSFSLEEGKITGFIGRNGAGKSTTLKSMFHFVHPDSGKISFFGKDFTEHEFEIKQMVGFVSGGVDYYPAKKLKTITSVTRGFYKNWDEKAYRNYLKMFALDENKTPSQLSAGMKVKYALALALSHNAKLLVLDEPTSGLDPVSRDDLLDVFMDLCDHGITILFSTHITSDLSKCADQIVYIKKGKVLAEAPLKTFEKEYQIAEFASEQQAKQFAQILIGIKRSKEGYTALVHRKDAGRLNVSVHDANLEEIMIHYEKEDDEQ